MTIRVHLMLNALATLLAVPLSGAITIAVAQTGKPPASSNMTSMAGDSSKHSTSTSMMPMMQTMETHMTGLAEHLSALEAEVRISVPSPTKVSAHTAEILKHADGLSELSGTSARTKSAAGKPTSRK
jgi:hypothetical protein